eukprot:tig00021012_g17005.t1
MRAPEEVVDILGRQPVPDDVASGDEYGEPHIVVDFDEAAIQARRDSANNFAHRDLIPADPKREIANALALHGGRLVSSSSASSQMIFSFASGQEIEDALHRMLEDHNLIWARKAAGFPDVARVVEFRAVRDEAPETLSLRAPFNV